MNYAYPLSNASDEVQTSSLAWLWLRRARSLAFAAAGVGGTAHPSCASTFGSVRSVILTYYIQAAGKNLFVSEELMENGFGRTARPHERLTCNTAVLPTMAKRMHIICESFDLRAQFRGCRQRGIQSWTWFKRVCNARVVKGPRNVVCVSSFALRPLYLPKGHTSCHACSHGTCPGRFVVLRAR